MTKGDKNATILRQQRFYPSKNTRTLCDICSVLHHERQLKKQKVVRGTHRQTDASGCNSSTTTKSTATASLNNSLCITRVYRNLPPRGAFCRTKWERVSPYDRQRPAAIYWCSLTLMEYYFRRNQNYLSPLLLLVNVLNSARRTPRPDESALTESSGCSGGGCSRWNNENTNERVAQCRCE